MHKFLHLLFASTALATMAPIEPPRTDYSVSQADVVMSTTPEPELLVDAPQSDPPVAEVAQVPEAPEPVPGQKEEPTVAITGPIQGFIDQDIVFLAELGKGEVTRIRWRISPEVSGLAIKLNGKAATFKATRPGMYRLIVAVAGPDGLDVREFEFEVFPEPNIIDETTDEEQTNNEPPPRPDAPDTDVAEADPPPPMPQPAEDPLAKLVVQLVNQVQSPNRVNEARLVATAYTQVASLIETGNQPVGTGASPFFDAQQLAVAKLGGAARPWVPFFPVSRPT